ncbi:uncharacterized protein LOC107818885 [Nicotiana tabacum]|uniref:Uncharacterized protein isoform X1 n=2 Tax=Nicotiana TaxID=4085 RepID=A0A1S4CGY3_TOBAC|nr:PREDICTED: uncharacterized protein LOC104247450 [Nicotiana sylvestris]XP_016500441.1 PREDICTED: uncharacterized protein LOC107818885 isoform X1 [Nicotiana tabacum]XP_016500442.1 PREDICTED: uncharacterized protein LOC107818885 isoform X2 [Nicotiana tabacum]
MIEKKRVQVLLFLVGLLLLSITAEKCRELVGQEAASKSGEFTWLHCFDGSTGTVACLVKEGVKLYAYNIRSSHVERARNSAIEAALTDAVAQGMAAKEAAKLAQKEGAKAAKLAVRQTKRIVGPIISGGWDFFEALYLGGTPTEGFLRGSGTLFGAYWVGYLGEQTMGRFGYLVGSELGSWVGGKVGLMVYDLVNGMDHLLVFLQLKEIEVAATLSDEFYKDSIAESSEVPKDSYYGESTTYTSLEASEESGSYEAPAYEDPEVREEF